MVWHHPSYFRYVLFYPTKYQLFLMFSWWHSSFIINPGPSSWNTFTRRFLYNLNIPIIFCGQDSLNFLSYIQNAFCWWFSALIWHVPPMTRPLWKPPFPFILGVIVDVSYLNSFPRLSTHWGPFSWSSFLFTTCFFSFLHEMHWWYWPCNLPLNFNF